MITIYSAHWHDDGIVECYSILQNATTKLHSLRVNRAKLIDVRDALYDAGRAFSLSSLDDEDDESNPAILDALAFVTEALQGRGPWVSLLRKAMRCLESLKIDNGVHHS